jgi:Family of unknown function (DUF6293)
MILECKGLVNVSVGSKIQAIASMMACMMFKDIAMIKPYYAVPENSTSSLAEEERQETEGLKDIIPMPEYKIEIPPQKLIKCLNIINQKTGGWQSRSSYEISRPCRLEPLFPGQLREPVFVS